MARCRKMISPRRAIALWLKWHGRCYWCERPLTPDIVEFDHYMPIELGGADTDENIVLSCFSCNRHKGQMHPRVAEFWFRHGVPKCAALDLFAIESGEPAGRVSFMAGAEFVTKERGARAGKQRLVRFPIAIGSCDSDTCSDCQ